MTRLYDARRRELPVAEVTRTRRGRILWPIVTRIADVIAWWQVDVRGKR